MTAAGRIGCRHAKAAWIGVIGLLAGLSPCAPAMAAEWTVQPYLDLGAMRDDNVRLTTAPHETTSAYVAAARMRAERETEVSKANMNIFVAHTRYHAGELPDKTEHGLKLDASRRTSERGTLGLSGEYRRDALFERVVVREEEGVGDVRDVDVGLTTEAEVRRHYRVLRPSWNWLLTERSSVRLAYRRTDVSFSNSGGTRLFDYEDDLLSGSYHRQLTQRDEFIVTTNVSRYRPDTTDAEADTLQLLVGRGRAFSETLRGSMSVGASRSKERVGAQEESSTGAVVNAALRQRSELSTLEGVISRDVTPSGIGRALRTDQVRLHWARKLQPMIELVFEGRFLRTRLIEGTDPSVNRRYYQISPELRWRWLENLSVVGSYRYRHQKFEASPDSADSSTVFLGVSYRL